MKFCILLLTLALSAWTAHALLDTALGSLSLLGTRSNLVVVINCRNRHPSILSLTAAIERFKCSGALSVVVSGKNSSTIAARDVPFSSTAVVVAAVLAVDCPDVDDDDVYIAPGVRSIIANGLVRPGQKNVVLFLLSNPPKDMHVTIRLLPPLISMDVRFIWGVDGYSGWTWPNLPGVILNVSRHGNLVAALVDTLGALLCALGDLIGGLGNAVGNLGG